MINYKIVGVGLVSIFITLGLTGCLYGPEQNSSSPIDPPPESALNNHAEAVNLQEKQSEKEKEASAKEEKATGVELFFLTDTGYVVPYTLNIPTTKSIAKDAMTYMVKDGPVTSLLPKGFTPILPAGTKVKGLDIKEGVATIDFSKEFLSYDEKIENELLEAVVWSLTGFDKVKHVNIWVEGKPLADMPKQKNKSQQLTRNGGINLEIAEGVNLTKSMPVTLYFLGQTTDNNVYYVPVTRMVNRTDKVGETVLSELIKGPLHTSKDLVGVLDTSLQVNKVKQEKDVVVADFGEQLLQYDNQNAAAKDAMQMIVLSLTENLQASKVKVTVNGDQSIRVNGAKNAKSDQPVTRPQMINPNGL
ncbi:GerMN domain-containing protein [Hazenella sp. IB182357]|uniref:GerMN domain-containing protein n=1 Tax=Polycladospora coralii TaxID=2771432 RepID=A0A926RTV8_9BACL|nr:GerMN domain-containing protein [Polycladospora coralii]MBD1371822.1 GerMN domain-containing protein [Polycladospora coralii]